MMLHYHNGSRFQLLLYEKKLLRNWNTQILWWCCNVVPKRNGCPILAHNHNFGMQSCLDFWSKRGPSPLLSLSNSIFLMRRPFSSEQRIPRGLLLLICSYSLCNLLQRTKDTRKRNKNKNNSFQVGPALALSTKLMYSCLALHLHNRFKQDGLEHKIVSVFFVLNISDKSYTVYEFLATIYNFKQYTVRLYFLLREEKFLTIFRDKHKCNKTS